MISGDALAEFLEILPKFQTGEDVESCIKHLLRTSKEFETCKLHQVLRGRLTADFESAVDKAILSGDLEDERYGCVRPDAVEDTVSRLVTTPSFNHVVDDARDALVRTSAFLLASGDTKDKGRYNAEPSAGSDPEGSHARKKVARRDDWSGLFDLCGGGFSAPVEIEDALSQLAAGLDGASDSIQAMETLTAIGILKRSSLRVVDLQSPDSTKRGGRDGRRHSDSTHYTIRRILTKEVDPEAFHFGNHWPYFLELTARALGSTDPAVHAKAMSLCWVMYEKAMGMAAADLCEGVLGHARRYLTTTAHVASVRQSQQPCRGASSDPESSHAGLLLVSDSELICAARAGKVLHGMLCTIHETFQHLPERRVWKIVEDFLTLLGDVSQSGQDRSGGYPADPAEHVEAAALGDGDGDGDSPSRLPAVILPSHFIAVAGAVDDWLPSWLRTLPTERLLRAINDSGVIPAMIRRCNLRGRIPFRPRDRRADLPPNTPTTPGDGASFEPEESGVYGVVKIRDHGLVKSACATQMTGMGSAVSLGRAVCVTLEELDHALLVQSVSFLGIVATGCRGSFRGRASRIVDVDGTDERLKPGLEPRPRSNVCRGTELRGEEDPGQGQQVLGTLVRCFRWKSSALGPESSSLRRQRICGSKTGEEVRALALRYIEPLAKVTAGAEAGLFTPDIIYDLFVPLRRTRFESHGSSGKSAEGRAGSFTLDEDVSVLKTVASIANVLLSSRNPSVGFLTRNGMQTEASEALEVLVGFAVELARMACSRRVVVTRAGQTVHGDGVDEGISTCLSPRAVRGLAVEYACAAIKVVSVPCLQARKAGWRALWRVGAPQALAELYSEISRCAQVRGDDEHGGNVCSSESGSDCKSDHDLNHKLILSLAGWARDLCGVHALRHVGLAKACASALSLELARRHLDPHVGDECPDCRPLLLASNLALCREGIEGLLFESGAMVSAMEQGLDRIGETADLAELLQCCTPDLRRSSPSVLAGNVPHGSGSGFVVGKNSGDDWIMRLPSLRNAGLNLRCLDFVRRFSLSSARHVGVAPARAMVVVELWRQWAVSRVGDRATKVGSHPPDMGTHGLVSEDECLMGLRVLADLATDLTVAVEVEAEWLLKARLREWRKCPFWGIKATAAQVADVGLGQGDMRISGPHHSESASRVTPGVVPSKGNKFESILEMPVVLDGVVVACARLEASLSCMGGPTEELHVRLRRLEEAEGMAPGGLRDKRVTGGVDKPVNDATPEDSEAWVKSMRAILEAQGSVHSDVARSLVRGIIASMGHRDKKSSETFALLSEAAGRELTFLPTVPTPEVMSHVLPADECRHDGSTSGGDDVHRSCASADIAKERYYSVMEGMCFSYARSLNLVRAHSESSFHAGMRRTLDMAAAAASGAAHFPPDACPPSLDCDWFTAVVFLASGADYEASSKLLRNISRHLHRAYLSWPLAGRLYAAARTEDEQVAPVAPLPVPLVSTRGSTNEVRDEDNIGRNGRTVREEPPAMAPTVPPPTLGVTAGAQASRGESPLLLLAAVVEELVESELPRLVTILRGAGCAAAVLAIRWMNQCMLNVVDWPGVATYLALTILRGPDFQVYFVVAVLRFVERRALDTARTDIDLTRHLHLGEALRGFDLEDALSYTEILAERYRSKCLTAMKAYLSS